MSIHRASFGRASCYAAMVGLLLSISAAAENWPCFRGPSRQGVSTEVNLPLHWSAISNVLWKAEIPGEGWSSPIVWGEMIFVSTAMREGKSLHLVCLERKTGKIKWDKEIFQQDPIKKEGANSFATPTPVTDGERVYLVSFNGAFAAVTMNGEVVWTNPTTKFYVKHGLAASAVLHEDTLVMPCDGTSTGADEYVGWQKRWMARTCWDWTRRQER